MEQTAVEWLVEYLTLHGIKLNNDAIHNVINQAKEMEKEQIIDAHVAGFYSMPFRSSRKSEAEQYYNETFK
jgi:hypothetical protein